MGQRAGGNSSVHTVLVSVVGAVIVMTALCCCIAFCCCKEMCGCLFGDTLSSGDYDLANLAEAGAAGAVLASPIVSYKGEPEVLRCVQWEDCLKADFSQH